MELQHIQQELDKLTAGEGLGWIVKQFPGQVVFSTSFGMEDQVLTWLISSAGLPVDFFTLDTGRLFPETYSTWSRTLERYPVSIKAYYPDAQAIQQFITEKGPNSFYESVENRKQCCYLRKVEPLQRALKGYQVWITGIRAEQSPERQFDSAVEWDETNRIIKYHPILHWTFDEVKKTVNEHNIPYNPLHDRGFVSIGCAPCTRAIREGEDFRAGRWWWEQSSAKECGLHVHATPSS